MCGIVGYFNLQVEREKCLPLLQKMCQAIQHRGPDDAGYFVDDVVGLGMRRLSIIDIAGGHQPISNEDGSMQIVFNGEVYNYRDVKGELLKHGHVFATDTDTEVILHQYEQDGAACVQHLNGMFTFAIWDERQQSLFLARDRLGIKPLYYYWDGQHFLFASEIKALLAADLTRQINAQAVWDYLSFRYVPQPNTIWQNIHKLPPGHTLTISLQSPQPSVKRYWEMTYHEEGTPRTAQEYVSEFENLFLDAVRLHLIADVPVGVLLSGGLDSSAVAAAVTEVHNAHLDSFSVAFDDPHAINELPYARQVAAHVGTNHYEVVIGEKEFCNFLPSLVHYSDEPLADLAAIPLHYVSKLARQRVTVVLSGEGSDEILGGYHFDQTSRKFDQIRQWQRVPSGLRRGVSSLIQFLQPEFAERLTAIGLPPEQMFQQLPIHMTNYMNSTEKRALWCDQVAFADSLDIVRKDYAKVAHLSPLHQMLYVYAQSWLVEDLLMKADKMTMANSLELRVPFLDYRIVEWAAQTPTWVKVKRENRRYVTKWVLRAFARKRLPPTILNRPKQGFPVPVYGWLAGRLKNWATDLLAAPDARLGQWFTPTGIQHYLKAGTSPSANQTEQANLWHLLILELWMRAWA